MPNPLTLIQRRVLLHIIEFQRENGFPPTLHEIKDAFGWASANNSVQHLQRIAKKGYLALPEGGKARGIKVLRRIRETA